jgi:AcrR family transcriptional regulator
MSGPRLRRSTEEIRRQMIEAAHQLFLEQGFDRTTTREVAEKAGVAEPLLFRHFESKTGLLEQVLVTPLSEFVETFLERWETDRTATTIEQRTRQYIASVYELMWTNRELLVHVLQLPPDHPLEVRNARERTSVAELLNHRFGRLAAMVRADLGTGSRKRTRHGRAIYLRPRHLHRPARHWLFPTPEPAPQLVIEELTAYVFATLDVPNRQTRKVRSKSAKPAQ